MLPPRARLSARVDPLVERGLYFVLHAPRQSGKTTLLHALAGDLNGGGRYTALVTTVEVLQQETSTAIANTLITERIVNDARRLPRAQRPPDPAAIKADARHRLGRFLADWSEACPRPLVLFIDEIDCLSNDVLVNVLRQLRAGHTARPAPFPHCVALVGLRNVRDYKVQLRADGDSLGTASPFNVKSDSLTLRNFTADEVEALVGQHGDDTGQVITTGAARAAWTATRGQPWLVNAVARQLVEHEVTDRNVPIEPGDVERAVEAVIERRDTHLDSLVDKLRDPRVRRVIEPVLVGDLLSPDVFDDDLQYVRDLGLIETEPNIELANPIYREVIPRALTFVTQRTIALDTERFVNADGTLDMNVLLRDFQRFFRAHAESWLDRFEYREAGPHLVLMAWLQRIVNGGGRITREFAIGSGRADLVVEWQSRRYAIELKIRRGDHTIDDGVAQLGRYLERLDAHQGWLVVFDRRATVSWDAKLFERQIESAGRVIHVFGA